VLLVVLRGVLRRAFKPLAELSATVDVLGERDLAPLPTATVPTEALGLVQAVNRLLDRLGTTLAQQRRLVSDAAHELRTPVTALLVQADNLGNVEMLPTARERMATLRLGLARMAALLEQLLSLARLQGARSKGSVEVDLRNVVRGVVESLLPMAEARRIDLGCVRVEACSVIGDPLDAMVLVRNAVDNAVKYTPAGGSVDVSMFRQDTMSMFVVEDSGPASPPRNASGCSSLSSASSARRR